MTEITIVEKLFLGFNTTFIGMGIVFIVLICLNLILAIQTKIFTLMSNKVGNDKMFVLTDKNDVKTIERRGVTSGETRIVGVEDEEKLAIIMATVSLHADIPLNQLKFKSIKEI